MALFGNAALASSKNLVEFRAGKMNLRETTVTADKRKGLVYVYQSEDSLMHFCWKDRTSGLVEDDLIIFPDDCEFKRLNQCTTGRAYILKFKSSTRKFFFWMQEPKTEKDMDLCEQVNKILNNPPTPGSLGSGDTGGFASGTVSSLATLGDQLVDNRLQSMMNNMDQNQLMQIFGLNGAGGDSSMSVLPSQNASRNTSAADRVRVSGTVNVPAADTLPAPTSVSGDTTSKPTSDTQAAVQLSDLQNILSNMQVPISPSANQESVDLSASFSVDALIPLLADKDVQSRLQPFLPAISELTGSEDELRKSIESPQFKQALSVFSAALGSGQLAPLMHQFNLPQSAIDAAAKGDIISFVRALQESETTNQPEIDEDMALD